MLQQHRTCLHRGAGGIVAQQQVLRLDVPVDELFRTQERQAGGQLQHEVPRRRLRRRAPRLNELPEVTAAAELQHDQDPPLRRVAVSQAHHVRWRQAASKQQAAGSRQQVAGSRQERQGGKARVRVRV